MKIIVTLTLELNGQFWAWIGDQMNVWMFKKYFLKVFIGGYALFSDEMIVLLQRFSFKKED